MPAYYRPGAVRTGLGLLALFASAPAFAATPIYFHKANVERERFASDMAHCMELAGGVNAPPAIGTYTPDFYAMAASSFFNGFFRSREKRHMIDNVLRTCMADKGYRRVKTSRQMLGELNRLSEKDRVDRLFALAAAPVPAGELLPK